VKVVDNFLPEEYQNALESLLLSTGFPWYLNQTTISKEYQAFFGIDNALDYMQFTHGFFRDGGVVSEHYGIVSLINYHLMLTENINTSSIYRMKANLNTQAFNYPKDYHYPIHYDVPKELSGVTCIYYVNDSDGDTIFFSSDLKEVNRVTPKKGRLVYFDNKTLHAGSPPKNSITRCVINFNFLGETI
jgi:hypothetical protein